MEILAHRGYWRSRKEQNTLVAFKRAIEHGFGIECDVRDSCKKLVISHDLPGKNAITFREVFTALSKHANFKRVIYAINIKSDGIEGEITRMLNEFGIENNSFVFDMSIPSMYIFYKIHSRHIAFACRLSDIEQKAVLYKKAKWVWLDELKNEWISNNYILNHIRKAKSVCIVSPELHGRNYLQKWRHYRLLPQAICKKVYLCTDFPVVADKFFNRSREK